MPSTAAQHVDASPDAVPDEHARDIDDADERVVRELLDVLEANWSHKPITLRSGVALAQVTTLRRRLERGARPAFIFGQLRATFAFGEPFRSGEVSYFTDYAPPLNTWPATRIHA